MSSAASHVSDMPSVSATDLKNTFADVWDIMNAKGAVAITRHEKPKAVLISIAQFEELVRAARPPLQELEQEFDELLARLQTPKAKKAASRAFHASPKELGKAAVRAARQR